MCICGSLSEVLFIVELYCTYRDVLPGILWSREEVRVQYVGDVIRLF